MTDHSASITSAAGLERLHCRPRKGAADGLKADEARRLLNLLPEWSLEHGGEGITRTFIFPDYQHTMRFVNAVAQTAHREDHHPDLSVHYDRCVVHYSTHDTGGLSLNDFICAAKADSLV